MKRWLRADGEVEFISATGSSWTTDDGRRRPEHRRSIIRQLLTEEQTRDWEVQPGYWVLPGAPP